MAVASTNIDGQNIGLRLLGQTSVTVFSLNLTTGAITSDYLTPSQVAAMQMFALNLFNAVPKTARAAGAIGLLSRLCSISPVDASTMSLTAPVSAGVASLVATVSTSPATLVATVPHSMTGGVMPGIVTTNASSGGGGGGGAWTEVMTSTEGLLVGDAVTRVPTTGRIRRADPWVPERMPAIGVVIAEKGAFDYEVQFGGPVKGLYAAGAGPTVYVGYNGRLTDDFATIPRLQVMGFWTDSSSFLLHIDPRVLVRNF